MRTPRLFPAPLDKTLIVEPLSELNEKLADPRVPVPGESTPVTILVPDASAAELSTVRTQVRSLPVTDVVPPKTMPFSV